MGKRKHIPVYHTHAFPGKRVRVTLSDGEQFVDKFIRYPSGNQYEFEKRGKVKASLVRKVQIYGKSKEIRDALIKINRPPEVTNQYR